MELMDVFMSDRTEQEIELDRLKPRPYMTLGKHDILEGLGHVGLS